MSKNWKNDMLADLQKELKHPIEAYQPRLTKFLRTMVRVRNLPPEDFHLWKVMDTVAFQDTETALKTTIYNVSVGPKLEKRRANQNQCERKKPTK